MTNNNQYNSIQTTLQNFIRLNNNNILLLSAITSSLTSDNQIVTVPITDTTGLTTIYQLPSYGYLMQNFTTINNDLKAIYNRLYQLADEPTQIESISEPDQIVNVSTSKLSYNR